MAAKTYEIAFKLAGKMSNDFSKTFKAANEAVKGFNSNLVDLNKQAANVDKVVKLRKETGLAARSYLQAKQKVAELGREISKSASPTQKMISDFNKAKVAVDKAKISLDKKRAALKEVEAAAGTTGVKLKTLIARQNELATSADRARAAQKKLADITARQQKIAGYQDKLKGNAGSSAASLAGMAAAATGTVGIPVKQAMAMEDAMAEVRKVTDFTPEGLEKARQELEMMSTRIPMAADGLAQIMAAAAQSGVAQKDLIGFTEQAAKMGVAFDISAEEAGVMMAKWQSGMGLTQEQTYKLADAVNALSNVNAATAPQIGEVLKRYGALGKVAGLTEKQTAAFAASVVASGAEAEVAATGIKAFMRSMSKGGSMSTKQAAAFSNVGLDPKQLQKNLQKDAPAAIIQTLEAIQKKIPKEQWNQYLSVMFGEEASVAVGPMMQNLEGLKENFKMVGDEAGYTGSMLNEFKARSATTSNALTLAKNAATYAARAIGQPLLAPLKQVSEEFVKNAVAAGNWIKNNQQLVVNILKIAGTVTGVIAAFHAFRIAMFFLVSPILSVVRGILAFRKAIIWAKNSTVLAGAAMKVWRGICIVTNATMKILSAGVKLLGKSMVFLFTNPIGLGILAFAALVAAGIAVYKNWDVIKAKIMELWGKFKEFLGNIKTKFAAEWAAAWEGIRDKFGSIFGSLGDLLKKPMNAVISIFNSVISKINGLSIDIPDWVPKWGGKSFGANIPQIPQLAAGGIATKPTMAMIGEGREDEAVLPLSKLKNMVGGGSGGGITVNFSPTINISGSGGNAYSEVERGLKEGQKNLKKELERLLQNQRRLSYV
jgi:TP901 family phage tail tape measure protein